MARTTIWLRLPLQKLFNNFLERIVADSLADYEVNVSLRGRIIVNIRFQDRTDQLAREKNELKGQTNWLSRQSQRGLE